MVAILLLTYALLAALELPPLFRQRDLTGERWTAVVLLVAGLLYGLAAEGPFDRVSVWPVLEAVFRPVGDMLYPE